jgi:hypothetical protein
MRHRVQFIGDGFYECSILVGGVVVEKVCSKFESLPEKHKEAVLAINMFSRATSFCSSVALEWDA